MVAGAATLPSRRPWFSLRRPTMVLVAGALAFFAAYTAWLGLRLGGEEGLSFLSNVVYQVPPAVATIALSLAAVRSRGRARLGWSLAALGMATWAAGEWVWSGYVFLDREVPAPSIADPLYYVGYLATMVALVVLVRPAAGLRGARKSLLDALIVVAVLAALSWYFVLSYIVADTESPLLGVSVNLGYPLLDLATVAVVVAALYRANWRLPLPVLLLAATPIVDAFGDALYLHLSIAQAYDPSGNPVELFWVVGYSLAAIAGLLQWERGDGAAAEAARPSEQHSRLGLALPYVLTLPLLGLLLHGAASGSVSPVVAVGSTLVVIGVGLRQWFTLGGNAHLYRRLAAQDRARKLLLDQVVTAQEQERHRIALDLHDEPIQALTFLAIRLSAGRSFLERRDNERCLTILTEVEDRLNEETQRLRQLMSELHPPVLDERGAASAIRDYAEGLHRETGIDIQVDIGNAGRLEPSVETIAYRIVQEALANVRRHSHAESARIAIRPGGEWLELEVSDDGLGFEPRDPAALAKEGHFGLLAMRQRAELIGGSCEVRSEPGKGTTVLVKVPAATEAE